MTIIEDRPLAEEAAIYDTTQPRDVVAALARVMAELGGIGKMTSTERARRGMGGGDTGISYAYRGIDQIAAAAQPLLGRYGVVIVPTIVESKVEQITVNGKPWSDSWVRVHWSIYGPGGRDDFIGAVTEGLGRDGSDKGANKAMTSAAKNLLLRLLMIGDPSDDSDGHTAERDQVDDQPRPLSDSWIASFRGTIQGEGFDPDLVLWTAFGNAIPNPLMPEHIPAMRDAFQRVKDAQGDTDLDPAPSLTLPLGIDDKEDAGARPATRPQIARIKAEYDRLEYGREAQLEFTSTIVARDIKTHNQLTVDEAETVIEALAHVEKS